MLLKLSEILSYMLYDCNELEVSLEKEIEILRDYMSLEKTRYGDKLEMNFQVKGHIGDKKIAPLLLLRFIENSFLQCGSSMTEQPWINLEMRIDTNFFYMKLMNGKPAGVSAGENDGGNNISQAQKRLRLLYPDRHELKIIEDGEIMMVYLEIKLTETEAEKPVEIQFFPELKESLSNST
jgi:LytS/YehU family sensor histidine kinase